MLETIRLGDRINPKCAACVPLGRSVKHSESHLTPLIIILIFLLLREIVMVVGGGGNSEYVNAAQLKSMRGLGVPMEELQIVGYWLGYIN